MVISITAKGPPPVEGEIPEGRGPKRNDARAAVSGWRAQKFRDIGDPAKARSGGCIDASLPLGARFENDGVQLKVGALAAGGDILIRN